jgi:hypothetical protein
MERLGWAPTDRNRIGPAAAGSRLALLAAVLAALALSQPLVAAQNRPQAALEPLPLDCRLASGPWQPCQMGIVQLGRLWWLQVGDNRFGFRHDGLGRVEMRRDAGGWQPVEPSWSEDQALCWDGICARGDIPLD